MADCQGRLTGEPGICFVTRGPGATNASAGLHIALQDSIADDPVHRPGRARMPASARLSRRSTTAASSATSPNGSARSTTPARIPEFVTRAFAVATSGRPGPVVIALPEDMLTRRGRGAGRACPTRRSRPTRAPPRSHELGMLLATAKRPFAILGGIALERGGEVARSRRLRRGLGAAGRLLLPPPDAVRPSAPELCRRCRHRHQPGARQRRSRRPTSCFWSAAGSAKCRRRTTRCSRSPTRRQTLVHVHPDAGELGRVYRPDARHQCHRPRPSPTALAELDAGRTAGLARRDGTRCTRPISPGRRRRETGPGDVQMGPIMD